MELMRHLNKVCGDEKLPTLRRVVSCQARRLG